MNTNIIREKRISLFLQPVIGRIANDIEASKEGKSIEFLTKPLVNSEITEHDAREYIQELIENQLLISEIEPNVSGRDFLDTLISTFRRIEIKEEMLTLLSIKLELEN